MDTSGCGWRTVLAPATRGTQRQTCKTTTRSDYWGYQVGHDISILNGGGTGANFHVGVTAGYLEARTKDITPAGSFFSASAGQTFFTPAGSFSEDAQVPFVGVYAAFTKGNLALDGQVRVDWHQNRLGEPLNGLFSQELNARGLSLTGNAAYNIPLQNRWFIEPGVGLVWSRVEVDPLNVAGVVTPPTRSSDRARKGDHRRNRERPWSRQRQRRDDFCAGGSHGSRSSPPAFTTNLLAT